MNIDVPKKKTDATTDECEQDIDDDVDWESIMYGYDDNDDVPTAPSKSIYAENYDDDDVPTEQTKSIFADDDDENDSEDIDDEGSKKKNVVKQLRFIDSFRFMASSLDKLSSNLDKSCFIFINFYGLSTSVGCWSSAFTRRIIYKFLNVCPFDYKAFVVSGKVGIP